MKGEEIIFEIDKTGATKISVNGVKGKSCDALTRDIEDALGTVTEKKHTRDYTAPATSANRATQR